MNLKVLDNYEQYVISKKKHIYEDGIRYVFKFPNGYGASLIKIPYLPISEYIIELAVLGPDGSITYDTSITDDVIRFEDASELLSVLEKIMNIQKKLTT